MNSLEIKNKTLSEMIDDQEQYSRRNCLPLHGVDEEDVEDTDQKIIEVIAEEMDIQLVEEDLDRTHRIGKKSDGKSRPIIIKFTRYNVRKKIYSNKKKLKGKNVMITESLTTAWVKLLKYCINICFWFLGICFNFKILLDEGNAPLITSLTIFVKLSSLFFPIF